MFKATLVRVSRESVALFLGSGRRGSGLPLGSLDIHSSCRSCCNASLFALPVEWGIRASLTWVSATLRRLAQSLVLDESLLASIFSDTTLPLHSTIMSDTPKCRPWRSHAREQHVKALKQTLSSARLHTQDIELSSSQFAWGALGRKDVER